MFISKLLDKNTRCYFPKNNFQIVRKKKVLNRGKRQQERFLMKHEPQQQTTQVLLSAEIWHQRLNHCGKQKLLQIFGNKVSKAEIDDSKLNSYDRCIEGKSTRKIIATKIKHLKRRKPLKLLVADAVGH